MYGGTRGYLNYWAFHFKLPRAAFPCLWNRTKKDHPIEGVSREFAKAVKEKVGIPVISTGGYQHGSFIRDTLGQKYCDAVSIARALVANNDLPRMIQEGCESSRSAMLVLQPMPGERDRQSFMGCYDPRRFDGDHDRMIREVMTVFSAPGFTSSGVFTSLR